MIHKQHSQDSASCPISNLFIFKIVFIYLDLAVLGFCHFPGFSLFAASGGYSPVEVRGFLFAVASLVVVHGSRARRLQQLWHTVLVAPWHVGSSWIRDWTCVSCTGSWILYHWALIYYSERIPSTTSKGRADGWRPGKAWCKHPVVCSQCSPKGHTWFFD